MPKKKAAKKALRQSIKRRKRNLRYKKKIKELLKDYKNLVAEKKREEAKALLPQIYKILDKAAKEKIIKKGKANRLKSKMAKMLDRAKNGENGGKG